MEMIRQQIEIPKRSHKLAKASLSIKTDRHFSPFFKLHKIIEFTHLITSQFQFKLCKCDSYIRNHAQASVEVQTPIRIGTVYILQT